MSSAAGADTREAWGWTERGNGGNRWKHERRCRGTGRWKWGDSAARLSQVGSDGRLLRRGGAGLGAGGGAPSRSVHAAGYPKAPRVVCDATTHAATSDVHGGNWKPLECEGPSPLPRPHALSAPQAPPTESQAPPLPTPILRAGRLDRCRLPVPPTRICSPGPESSRPARPLLLHHQPLGCCDSYQPWRAGRGRSQEPGSSTGRDGVSPGPRGRGGLISGPRPAPRMGDERRSPLLPQHRLCLSAGRGRAQPAPRPHPDTRPLGLVAMETVPGGRPAGPNNLTPGWGATSPVGGVRLRVHLRGGGGSVDALGAAAFRCSAVHPQRPHEWRNLPKVTALSSRLRVPRARALGLCPRVAESPTDCSGPARDAVLSDPSVSSTR